MKYFGTDGIRGIVRANLSPRIIRKVARAIVRYYRTHKLRPFILVGNDSRSSSDYILSILSSILLKCGIEIHNMNRISSPALAYLTRHNNYPLGLMLSASHNPSEYNGLKFFNSLGEKVSDEFEEEFEYLMDKSTSLKSSTFANLVDMSKLKDQYIAHLKSIKKFHCPLIIDCANGGASDIVRSVFPNAQKINANPNGININQNAGCTHIERLRSLCIRNKKIGFALDGDGDRIHIVTEKGEILNGDKILYILSKFFLSRDDVVVGTIYTNSALEESLKKHRKKLIRAYVGDKNVYKEMIANNSSVGGEESGHIILRHYTNTGDGLLTAIIIGNILNITKSDLETLLVGYNEYYQARANIKVTDNFSLDDNTKKLIHSYELQGSRILIRPSGTEPVIRVFVEDKIKENAEKIVKILENSLKN